MRGGGTVGRGFLDSTDAAFVDVVSDLLRRGHSVRFRAKGGSMHPTIREGEAITVAPATPGVIRRGDVILYRSGQSVIAHRVARVTRLPNGGLVFIPRSDASGSCDGCVDEAAILGKVTSVERNGRALNPTSAIARTRAWARSVAVHLLRRLGLRPQDV